METEKLQMSDKWYDRAKWFVQLFLPAFGALYLGLSDWWGLPKSEAVAGTTLVVSTFLGTILMISTKRYNNSDRPFDGQVVVGEVDDGIPQYTLQLNDDIDPFELDKLDKLTFKIEK